MISLQLLKGAWTVVTALGLAVALGAAPAAAGHKLSHNPGGGGGGGGDAIQFTAELSDGAFVFGPVDVTPNSRESVLRGIVDLDLVRPGDDNVLDDTWDDVFAHCLELSLNPVGDFRVGDDDWRIAKAGGVRVIFNNIQLPGAEVTVHLIGEEFDFLGDPFLPESGNTSVFILTKGSIWADSAKGEPGPRRSCSSGEFDLFNDDSIILEITAD